MRLEDVEKLKLKEGDPLRINTNLTSENLKEINGKYKGILKDPLNQRPAIYYYPTDYKKGDVIPALDLIAVTSIERAK